RLDEQPPEALAVRVQEREAIRLQERPRDAAEHRQRAEQADGARPCGTGAFGRVFRDQLRAHSTSPGRDDTGPAVLGATAGLRGERRRPALEGEAEQLAR